MSVLINCFDALVFRMDEKSTNITHMLTRRGQLIFQNKTKKNLLIGCGSLY